MQAYLLSEAKNWKQKLFHFLGRKENFYCKKTFNKKFFFQQFLLIFAVLLKKFYNLFCLNFFNDSLRRTFF